jgi:hypothetical protein
MSLKFKARRPILNWLLARVGLRSPRFAEPSPREVALMLAVLRAADRLNCDFSDTNVALMRHASNEVFSYRASLGIVDGCSIYPEPIGGWPVWRSLAKGYSK